MWKYRPLLSELPQAIENARWQDRWEKISAFEIWRIELLAKASYVTSYLYKLAEGEKEDARFSSWTRPSPPTVSGDWGECVPAARQQRGGSSEVLSGSESEEKR